MTRSLFACAIPVLSAAVIACGDDVSPGDEQSMTDSGDDSATGATAGCGDDVEFQPADETPCAPGASDYTPGSADDPYPACIADSGAWTLIGDPPGAAARTEAYAEIRDLLRGGSTPTVGDFTQARVLYATSEGLESRVLRREDLHYPPVAAGDQDPGQDFDKQCAVGNNVEKYPDRCVGPAKIAPIINASFDAAMAGTGDPGVHAAKIDAAIAWFLFVSGYKESASCVQLPEDCDSHWAYLNGATVRTSPIGLGGQIRAISSMAHDRIYDAQLGIRCWRDLYPGDADPTWDELPSEGQTAFLDLHEQLDNALWYGWARLVRDHVEAQAQACGGAAAANWAYLQVVGPVLAAEAQRRDPTDGGAFAEVWSAAEPPDSAALQVLVEQIDATFPCPQCPDCDVPQGYGY